ncbi:MAG: hypothetical protein IPM29_07340 [Planctomycetes bacterium]|nr:hypothetical protein [Planctomycetota bacterium]
MRRPRVQVAALAAALAGCSSDPEPFPGRPVGPPRVVRLVDDGWVELDGERMTIERLIYTLRLAVRAAADHPERRPWLELRTPRSDPPWAPAMVQRIRSEAYAAGIGHLELGLEDA